MDNRDGALSGYLSLISRKLWCSFLLSTKFPLFKTNKQLDICLTLFFSPYFDEFYKEVLNHSSKIPSRHRKYLTKNLLFWLSSAVYYNIVYQTYAFCDSSTKDHFIKKDIYNKSKELIELLTWFYLSEFLKLVVIGRLMILMGRFWGTIVGGAVGNAISGTIMGAGISMVVQEISVGYSTLIMVKWLCRLWQGLPQGQY